MEAKGTKRKHGAVDGIAGSLRGGARGKPKVTPTAEVLKTNLEIIKEWDKYAKEKPTTSHRHDR